MCNDCGESKGDVDHEPRVYPAGIKVHDIEKDGKPWKRITWREHGEFCEIVMREGGPETVDEAVKKIEERLKRQANRPGWYYGDERDQT